MKEIIVIPKDKIKVLTSCGHFPANGYFTFNKEDAKVERVPETFEELKTMCKDSEVCINITKGDIKGSQFECIEIAGLILCENKNIYIDTLTVGIVILVQNRTPAQMWNIIKSLIGEE